MPEPTGHLSSPAGDRRLARRLLIASFFGYAATVACYLLLIRTSLGRRFDRAAYLGVPGQSPTALKVNSTILQQITGYSLSLALLILVVIGVWRRRPLLGLAAALAAGLTVLSTSLAKSHVFTTPSMFSTPTFPSGHTATAVACAMALLFVTPPAGRGVAAVIAGSYGWVTAAQVQVAGWHRLSDAIGAACLAFASVAAVSGVTAWVRPVDRDRRGVPKWAVAVLGTVALAAAALAAWGLISVLGNLGHHSPGTESPAVRHGAYLTGMALTIGVVVVLLLVLILLFGPCDFDGRDRIVESRSLLPRSQITGRGEEAKRARQPAGCDITEA